MIRNRDINPKRLARVKTIAIRSRVERRQRRGISLLEVLLAIAILGMSVATVGELVRIGALAAANTRDMTAAQMMAETKVSELTSGLYPLTPVTDAADEFYPDWTYTVQVEQIDQEGLVAVQVTVKQNLPESQRPIRYSLVRWMREADLEIDEETEETEETGESTGDSGGAAGGGATGGATSGGATGGAAGGAGGR